MLRKIVTTRGALTPRLAAPSAFMAGRRWCATTGGKGAEAKPATPSDEAAEPIPPPPPPPPHIIDGIDYTGYLPMKEFQQTVIPALQEKYGQGAADLHRVLYKELCDELRRERWVKPPSPEYSFGEWEVVHTPGSAKLIFKKKADTFEVVVGTDIKLGDPKQLNETLTFLNWYPMDVLVRRESVVMHFMVSAVEKQLILRNVRAYTVDDKVDLMAFNAESDFQRFYQHYDGPFLYHLELDMQTEMYDLMLDAGVTSYFLRYVGEWVAYMEHVEYTRWVLNMLEATIPGGIADERQLLSFEDRRNLDEEVEEWRDVVRA